MVQNISFYYNVLLNELYIGENNLFYQQDGDLPHYVFLVLEKDMQLRNIVAQEERLIIKVSRKRPSYKNDMEIFYSLMCVAFSMSHIVPELAT